MKSWSVCSTFLILCLSLSILLIVPQEGQAQYQEVSLSLKNQPLPSRSLPMYRTRQDTTVAGENHPDPTSVLYKSLLIPGWGQVVNKQIWKVPIVYGLIGGLAWYSVYTQKKYHDYRAAYYNAHDATADDLRFGRTPAYIPDSYGLEQLRSLRNTYRNRRDQIYIGVVLAYGLNVVDAYVFAHMRSFDVSENLSMRPRIKPGIPGHAAPGMTLSLNLITNNN